MPLLGCAYVERNASQSGGLAVVFFLIDAILFMFYDGALTAGGSGSADVYTSVVGSLMILHLAWRLFMPMAVDLKSKVLPWMRFWWAGYLYQYWRWVPVPLFQFVLWIPQLILLSAPVDKVYHLPSSRARQDFVENGAIVVGVFAAHWFLEILLLILCHCLRPVDTRAVDEQARLTPA